MDDGYQLLDQDYDPLADGSASDVDECAAETEIVQVIGDPEAQSIAAVDELADERDARQKIEDLLRAMRPQRAVLLGIISFCRQPRLAEEVDQRIAELCQHLYMVYDGVELRRLLQESEGLEYLEPEQPPAVAADDGTPAAAAPSVPSAAVAADAAAPTAIGDDGVEYLVIQRRETGRWLSTAAAIELLESEDPEADFWALLNAEPQYRSVYQAILETCRDSHSIKELDAKFNDHPLLAEPRRYSGYFIERLEKCGALAWRGGWLTSDVGLGMLTRSLGE